MSGNGKGDLRRPCFVPEEKFAENWDRAFGPGPGEEEPIPIHCPLCKNVIVRMCMDRNTPRGIPGDTRKPGQWFAWAGWRCSKCDWKKL